MTANYADYDHHGTSATPESAYQAWSEMRATCPIGRSEAHGGMWVVTGYPETVEILRDPDRFSSFPATLPSFPQESRMIPVELDPPDHQRYRALLAGPFSPRRAREYEEPLRDIVNSLIDEFIEAGACDAFAAMAVPLPALLATVFLGVPVEDGAKLQGWIRALVHETASRPAAALEGAQGIYAYFGELLAQRMESQRAGSAGDDLISVLLRATIDGQSLRRDEFLGFAFFLLLASIDTSQKVIGSILWRLANDPVLTGALVADPALIPAAAEEFLRLYAPVLGARRVTREAEVGGVRMAAGDRILLLLGAASRDERNFGSASEFILGRPNAARHLAFGDYIHKCLGIHIARVELTVMLEEWLRRIPEFEPQLGEAATWSNGQVQGVIRVPIKFPKAARRS
jgi:cytochrome P450